MGRTNMFYSVGGLFFPFIDQTLSARGAKLRREGEAAHLHFKERPYLNKTSIIFSPTAWGNTPEEFYY